jgi:uncharacterized membrane protein
MRSVRLAAIAFAMGGLGISLYLTVVHISQDRVLLLCSSSGLVNCEQVLTSSQSVVGPFPVAVLGVVWFIVLLVLLLRGDGVSPRRRAAVQLAWAVGGIAVVFYLIYVELFLVGAICLWCAIVHLFVILLLLASVAEYAAAE